MTNYCIIIPTYNNQTTLAQVIDRCLAVTSHLIVVNDGSTDDTARLLEPYVPQGVKVIAYPRNRGKGYALRCGLEKACAMGYDYAVTLDADGQHFPEDVPQLLAPLETSEEPLLVVGSRAFDADGMPHSNQWANRFSNFWFRLQTGISLPDTQSGFRAYPLGSLPPLRWLTRRYESELELLVWSAWRGVRLKAVEVRVYYPPKDERVTHFRPWADFARISLLNAVLCFGALFYGRPAMLLRRGMRKMRSGKVAAALYCFYLLVFSL